MAKQQKPLSKTKRRDILLKLAAHIEKHPDLYDFFAFGDHLRAGVPMCPLQRVAKFLRLRDRQGESALRRAALALGFKSDDDFYSVANSLLSTMRKTAPSNVWLLRVDEKSGTTIPQVVMALRYMAAYP